ncbi:MAG TPA: fatty acid desaturase [Allosphingosinicella sp.]
MFARATEDGSVLPDARTLLRDIAAYAKPVAARSVLELVITAVPFLLLMALMWWAVSSGYWLGLLLALPAGAFLVRLFMVQHDCSHGSFFRRRAANDWVGRVLGVLTLTPYDCWRRTHAVHHARNGNLDSRGMGDVETLTVREFRERSAWQRFRYRLYRHPVVMFGLGPAFLFLIHHRLPVGLMRSGWGPWVSVMATNAVIAIVVAAVLYFGAVEVLLIYLPVMLVAATAGVWLFYVQHQFEETMWERDGEWTFHEAALRGSSHYDLPAVLRWFTANIGIHHVHHLASRIPCYRLGEVLRDRPELRQVGRLTLRDSLRTVRLALWDEDKKRLVTFRDAKAAS